MLFSIGVWSTVIYRWVLRYTHIINTLLGKWVYVGLIHVLNRHISVRPPIRPHYFLLSLWVARVDTCSLWGYRDAVRHKVHVCELIIVLSGPFLTHVHPDWQLAVVPIIIIDCHLLLKWIFLLTDRLRWLDALWGKSVGLMFKVMFLLRRLFEITARHDFGYILMSRCWHSKLLHHKSLIHFLASIQQSTLVLHL